MHQNVEACDVHRAKRRALRPANRGSGDGVDLLDAVLSGRQCLENSHQAVHRHMVRDEAWRILGDDHVLAQPPISANS